jgi:hypothetical protein
VVADKGGEYEVTLVATIEPLVEASYQSIVQSAAGVALNVTAPELQRELLLAPVGALGTSLIVTATEACVLSHPAAEVVMA